MWKPPTSTFEVQPLVNVWAGTNDFEKKKLFAAELAKGVKPFEAATKLFDDTGLALWVSQNWTTDIAVVEATKIAVDENVKLLDKEVLAAKVLRFSEERDPTGRFYLAEDKTRLAALKLYAEICGYVGKVDIDASTKNFTNNEMKIVLVSPPEKPLEKVVEHEPKQIENVVPLKVKLVS